MIDARIDAANTAMSRLESARYTLSLSRHELVRMAHETIAPFFYNAPEGVMQLTEELLVADDATYLVVDLKNEQDFIRRRMILTKVGFKMVDGAKQAYNLETGELLGQMNRLAITPRWSWKNEDWHYPNPQREAAYTGLVLGSPSKKESWTRCTWVLPMTGPALRHPVFQRMANLANAILLGNVNEIKKLRWTDDADEQYLVYMAKEQAIIDGVIEEAAAKYQPREWDAELVRLMETMDWTFDYADRPNSAFYEQRRQIQARLHALPLEVALAFLDVAGVMWKYAYNLLHNHPGSLTAAA